RYLQKLFHPSYIFDLEMFKMIKGQALIKSCGIATTKRGEIPEGQNKGLTRFLMFNSDCCLTQ
ncbi:hypothetical protein O0J82_11720, partial [Staphylococcus pseudintermedius]|nr:hypothetical protein [Staphylococcus pseudintermedius]